MQVLGIEHVDLSVSDLAASTLFYDLVLSALGFRRVDHPSYRAWSNGQLAIGLREATSVPRATPVDRYKPGLHHLALRAASRVEVDELHTLLVARGVNVLDAPAVYPEYGADYYAIFFADPDGMKLEYTHFPWGYWRRAQTDGHDERPRLALAPGTAPTSRKGRG